MGPSLAENRGRPHSASYLAPPESAVGPQHQVPSGAATIAY